MESFYSGRMQALKAAIVDELETTGFIDNPRIERLRALAASLESTPARWAPFKGELTEGQFSKPGEVMGHLAREILIGFPDLSDATKALAHDALADLKQPAPADDAKPRIAIEGNPVRPTAELRKKIEDAAYFSEERQWLANFADEKALSLLFQKIAELHLSRDKMREAAEFLGLNPADHGVMNYESLLSRLATKLIEAHPELPRTWREKALALTASPSAALAARARAEMVGTPWANPTSDKPESVVLRFFRMGIGPEMDGHYYLMGKTKGWAWQRKPVAIPVRRISGPNPGDRDSSSFVVRLDDFEKARATRNQIEVYQVPNSDLLGAVAPETLGIKPDSPAPDSTFPKQWFHKRVWIARDPKQKMTNASLSAAIVDAVERSSGPKGRAVAVANCAGFKGIGE
jgi:hypothetical protein